MPGGPGGCGGGGGMTPIHPSPPSRTPGGSVTAPPTHSLPSPLIFGNVGGEGTDYNAGPNGGTGGGGGGCGPNGGTGSNNVPDTNGTAPSGGDDYICPSSFLPVPSIPTLAAALGTPGKFWVFQIRNQIILEEHLVVEVLVVLTHLGEYITLAATTQMEVEDLPVELVD